MEVTVLDPFIGQVIKDIVGLGKESQEVVFTFESGRTVKMYHIQDCCEWVCLSDFEGDASDLVGGMVIKAEERCEYGQDEECYSSTWTFYDIQTTKGSLWMRWVGESNGYYSESVDIEVTE